MVCQWMKNAPSTMTRNIFEIQFAEWFLSHQIGGSLSFDNVDLGAKRFQPL